MSLPYKATSVAIYFLRLGKRDEVSISHMKLQKLIYFAHGWCLAICGQPLIKERVEAWRYGPVIDSVYQMFRSFGADPITSPSKTSDRDYKELQKDNFTTSLLERVWEVYSEYDAYKLSAMTHLRGSPWTETRRCARQENKINGVIDDELMRKYFVSHAKDHG